MKEGDKINHWVLLRKLNGSIALFKCDCGTIKENRIRNIVNEKSKSCGCVSHFYIMKNKLKNGFKYKTYISSNGYVKGRFNGKDEFMHRFIMREELSRYKEKMHVHHIDGNKTNNDKSNLMIVSPNDHNKFEKGWKYINNCWFKPCTKCLNEMEVNTVNFYKRKAGEFLPACKKCTLLELKNHYINNILQ